MKQLLRPALLVLALPCITAHAQVFDLTFDDGVNFDMTGWDWFCSVPEFFAGVAAPGGGAASLGLPANDGFSACFSGGEVVGVHHLLPGIQLGVDYDLSVWSWINAVMEGGDLGFFAYTAGVPPSSFGGVSLGGPIVYIQDSPNWIDNSMTFSLPTAWAGQDVYLFIEYSIAPDPEGVPKFFDSIHLEPSVSTGVPADPSSLLGIFPDPAMDVITVRPPEGCAMIDLFDANGSRVRSMAVTSDGQPSTLDISDLPAGVYGLFAAGRSPVIARFVKL